MRTSSHFLENESISIENESVCCADNKNHIEPSDKKTLCWRYRHPYFQFQLLSLLFFRLSGYSFLSHIQTHTLTSCVQQPAATISCVFDTQQYLCSYPSNTETSVIVMHYRLHYSFTRFRQPIFSAVWPSTFSSSIHLIWRKCRNVFRSIFRHD